MDANLRPATSASGHWRTLYADRFIPHRQATNTPTAVYSMSSPDIYNKSHQASNASSKLAKSMFDPQDAGLVTSMNPNMNLSSSPPSQTNILINQPTPTAFSHHPPQFRPSSGIPSRLHQELGISNSTATNLNARQQQQQDYIASPKALFRVMRFQPDQAASLRTLPSAASFAHVSARNYARPLLPATPFKILDAPNLSYEHRSELLSWSASGFVLVALGDAVHGWRASDNSVHDIVLLHQGQDRPPRSISAMAPSAVSANLLAVASSSASTHGEASEVGAFASGVVHIHDMTTGRPLRRLTGGALESRMRISSISWKDDHVVSFGGIAGLVSTHDTRLSSSVISTLDRKESIGSLRWSPDGHMLASGADDGSIVITSASSSPDRPLHTFCDHTNHITSLSWCPWNTSTLASGAAFSRDLPDGTIKLWSTQNSGVCISSVGTKSGVCSLAWSHPHRELTSAQGCSSCSGAIGVWRWSKGEMTKVGFLGSESSSPSMFTVASPNGETLVAASPDDMTMMFWRLADRSEEDSTTTGKGYFQAKSANVARHVARKSRISMIR